VDALRRVLANIRTYLGQLPASGKLIIALTVVIAALVLFVVSQMASKPSWVELLPGAPLAEQQQAIATLKTQGIRYQTEGNKLMVSPGDEWAARAALSEAGKMPADVSQLFKNILEKQTWHTSRYQSEQLYNVDLQGALGKMIGGFTGVKGAQVILDVPEPNGLGAAVRKPSATASVTTGTGRPLTQQQVDAIANLVAGAKAGLDVSLVKVIDVVAGRERRATRPDQAATGTYMEHAAAVERQMVEKLGDLLAGIPGIRIAVTAQVDVTSVNARVRKNLPTGEGTVSLLKKSDDQKTVQSEPSRGAEPGPRSNQTADINRGGGKQGAKSEMEMGVAEMENHVGTRDEQIVDPRGMPTGLAASINVPRGYIVKLLAAKGEAAKPDAKPAEPSDKEIEDRFKLEQTRIETLVKPHLKSRGSDGKVVDGEVVVSLVPGEFAAEGTAATASTGVMSSLGLVTPGGGGSGFSLGGGLLDKALVALLAVVALGMMVMMVKKQGKKVDLPSAEELVGIPPSLEIKNDLVGEADEGETVMTGIEIDEGAIQQQKMLESVGEFVKTQPDGAARLVKRWLVRED
jgi:flagellar biosynthesis/type III secretory pathway M-ring protein FliF/YscJ